MRSRKLSGIIGMVFGAALMAINHEQIASEGLRALGIPMLVFVVGLGYFIKALHAEKQAEARVQSLQPKE